MRRKLSKKEKKKIKRFIIREAKKQQRGWENFAATEDERLVLPAHLCSHEKER